MDVDQQGDLLMAYADRETSSGLPCRVWLQKVTPTGQLPWGVNGVEITSSISTLTTNASRIKVVCLTDGAYGVMFSRKAPASNMDVTCVQKVSAAGGRLWNGGQAIVISDPVVIHTPVVPIAGADGSVIISFLTDDYPNHEVQRGLYLQRLEGATGARAWNGGQDVVIERRWALDQEPDLIGDDAGGVFVAWCRPIPGDNENHLQHVDANGAVAWGPEGVASTDPTLPGRQQVSPRIGYDPQKQVVYMVYPEMPLTGSSMTYGLYAQAFDMSGNRLWGAAGREIEPLDAFSEYAAGIAPSEGGPVLTWFHRTTTSGPAAAVMRTSKLRADGSFATPIITANSAPQNKTRSDVTRGSTVVAAYSDGPSLTLTRINPDGTVGNPCGTADFDGDGDFGTDFDIQAFFACLGGNCCAACFPGGSDFNGDGDFGTDADIESFFRVLSGGAC